jgi:hypothetical protein
METSERPSGENTPTYSHHPPREDFIFDEIETPGPANDIMTPSHGNLTSSKTPDMGDLQHPEAPRPSRNDAKKFTFDFISADNSLNISDSRDVQNNNQDEHSDAREGKGELRDEPMEIPVTEDEGVGSNDTGDGELTLTLKIDDDGKANDITAGCWYLCGIDPTELMTLTTIGASINHLITPSLDADTTDKNPDGKDPDGKDLDGKVPDGEDSVPFDEDQLMTPCCQVQDEPIEETTEANIDPAVANTLKAVIDRLHPIAEGQEDFDEDSEQCLLQRDESRTVSTHGPETPATAAAQPIAPICIFDSGFVDSDIELAPSDEMENRSAPVTPGSPWWRTTENDAMFKNADVSFDNLKAFQAYV